MNPSQGAIIESLRKNGEHAVAPDRGNPSMAGDPI
jgi:hypothetical protein